MVAHSVEALAVLKVDSTVVWKDYETAETWDSHSADYSGNRTAVHSAEIEVESMVGPMAQWTVVYLAYSLVGHLG